MRVARELDEKPNRGRHLAFIAAGSMCLMLLASCAGAARNQTLRALPWHPVLEQAAAHDLVEVREVIPDLVVDLRYTRGGTALGGAVYPPDMPCLLHRDTALKLAKAQRILREQGYQLSVWDAWRPTEVQRRLLREAPNPGLFRDPDGEGWSGHCAGRSVDVTLLDANGRPCRMPTWHDEESEHTTYYYQGKDRAIAWNVHRLQMAMHRAGFRLLETEWWHFDDSVMAEKPVPVDKEEDLGLALH